MLFDQTHHQHDCPGASSAQATFVLVNIYIGAAAGAGPLAATGQQAHTAPCAGNGLLSMPYALAQCGWLGLPLLAAVTGAFGWAAHLIIRAFSSLPRRATHSYPELGVRMLAQIHRVCLRRLTCALLQVARCWASGMAPMLWRPVRALNSLAARCAQPLPRCRCSSCSTL